MAALQCEICGGKLMGRPGGIFECDSCGMEYDTAWARAKIQEIKGTVRVEGTVEVKGTVKVEGSASAENLLKRGFMQLEDRNWAAAEESFNQVLGADTENARAYLGLAMAQQQISRIDDIAMVMQGAGRRLRESGIKSNRNFKRAETFADTELKEMFTHWRALEDARYAALEAASRAREAEKEAARKEKEERMARIEQARKSVNKVKHLFSVGFNHILAVKPDGTVMAAGKKKGQCDVSHMEDIVAIYTDDAHSVGLRADGTVVATRFTGEPSDYADRCEVKEWKDIVAIATYSTGTFGVTKDGYVRVTAKAFYLNEDKMIYLAARGWTDVVSIATGFFHAIGLKKDGTVVADLENRCDKDLLTGRVIERKPEEEKCCQVQSWCNIIDIAAGMRHSVGLKSDGTVVAVGNPADGALDVTEWKDIVSITAGNDFTAGLKLDGTVVSTSRDHEAVKGWTDVVAITASYGTLAGLKADGTIVSTRETDSAQISGWKLFENADNIEEERETARRLLAERKAAAIRERKQNLQKEKDALMMELESQKGLFKVFNRIKINERLAEIETELKGLS